MSVATSRHVWLLLILLAVAWFGTLEYRKFIKPDEGRYAEIPREMVASGDWLTPRLNDLKYFEKPPLQYWATAAAFDAFGEHHWTARLWTALTGFLGILLTGFATARLWGRNAGLASAAVLASSALYVIIGHVNTLDMGVSFFLAAAVFAFVLAQRDGLDPSGRRRYMLGAWLALALAMLSKGLIALVLPGATLVLYTLWQRDWVLWKRLHLASGFALFLAVAAPWFVAVSLANPEFFNFFFIHEHFERFLTKTHGRYQPAWYFLPILALGLLPWITLLPQALQDGWRPSAGRFQPGRFLVLWALVVFTFFSASDSKLASYILPIFPALAVLIGRQAANLSPGGLRWHALPMAVSGIAIVILAPRVVDMADVEVPVDLYQAYVPWLIAAGAVIAMAAFGVLLWPRRAGVLAPVLLLAAGGHLAAQLFLLGHDSLAPANSAYFIAEKIRPELKDGIPFFSVNTYDQTLQPYLGRTTTMVLYKDELEFGIGQEPQKFIPTLDAFEAAWREAREALALMPPDTHQYLVSRHLPMRLVAEDTRRIIVAKP